MRLLLVIPCLLLSGCFLWDDEALPAPATDRGLSGAESRLDHLTEKRDSRVAAAVTVAKDISTEDAVKNELEVAQGMLPAPTAADLAFARDRADSADDAFYAKQVEVSRQLAVAIIEANRRYESEKARKQAEYDAALKEKELALAAEQEARQSDKWTYAGIALVTLGLLAAFLSPMKLAGAGVALSGIVVGSFPVLSKSAYFPYVIGGLVLSGIIAAVITRRKPSDDATQTPPQG